MVSTLRGLQNLFLQSLPHIESIPALSDATALRRVALENLKGLNVFGALECAPAPEEFELVGTSRQYPEDLLPVLRNSGVRRVGAYFTRPNPAA